MQVIGLRPHTVARWHALLCAIAVLNLALWLLSAIAVSRGSMAISMAADTAARLQLLLSAGYVFGCAFRSVLPVYDIPRIVLVDCRLSNVVFGRTVATFAELCFAAQWALILHRTALLSHSLFGQAVSLGIVPLIVIAEGFSWYAVMTTAQRGHAVENSIWGLSAVLVVASLLVIGPHRLVNLYPPMIIWCLGGAAYVVFMFLYDVPMYWSRWRASQTAGHQYLSITQGIAELCGRRVVSYRWEDWRTEVLWMSLYFTLGVWSSISIVYAALALGTRGHP
ncbi:MAG TPA: hypothetical protein VGF89_09935 [Steroidobacteraceae bacterium]